MRVSYHHANPAAGNESFLLRFRGVGESTPCLLVDAGNGVDMDALTEPDDRLVGICLTHAHLDHYATLAAAHREGVPILVSPGTGAILGDVLDVAGTEYGVDSSRAVRDAITPVAERQELAPGVSVRPVPAGHAPGAVGWLVGVTDGDDTHRLLATGDFTRRRVAGEPGLPAESLPPVDALFLTASTNERFEAALTEALGTALEHAGGGKRTLVAASGLTGVHVAYLLSAAVEQYGLRVPVRVVGQAAKLYDRLGYDRPGVEPIPRFDDPRACLGHGVVTVAGPEIPRERSSGRMFGLLREDPNGSVIQLVGSGAEPLTDARCTLHDYEIVNHPTRATLTAVHDAIDPRETVMVHAHRGADRAFNDLDSVVWGTGDRAEYTLYDGTGWRLPPWMDRGYVAGGSRTSAAAHSGAVDTVPAPATGRETEPDLAAEGVDTERLADLLHHRQGSVTDTASPAAEEQSASDAGTTGDDTTPRVVADGASATDDTQETMSDNEDTTDGEPDRPTPDGPVRTTGTTPDDGPDPAVKQMLEAQNMSPEEFTAAVESVRAEATDTASTTDTESTDDDSTADSDTRGHDHQPSDDGPDSTDGDDTAATNETGSDGDSDDIPADENESDETTEEPTQTDGATSAETVSADTAVATNGSQASPADGGTASRTESTETESQPTPAETESQPTPAETATAETESAETAHTRADAGGGTTAPTGTTDGDHPTVSPLALALAPRAVEETEPAAAAAAAVERYLVAVLAGDVDTENPDRLAVDISGHPAVETALGDAAAATDRFADSETLVGAATAAALGVAGETDANDGETSEEADQHAEGALPTPRPVSALAPYADQLDGIVANDDSGFETKTAVVDSAVAWAFEHAE